ncbi:hypothetical protein BBJ28_00000039 [Nothophytophthora sp. Chile5]|nr:hypothetical protein BBJ28_00000039 [Nothophytophthora sp. Chile5]
MNMIGREPQLQELARVAGLHSRSTECADGKRRRVQETPAPLVIVYGGASTGKSVCLASALRQHSSAYALVDCTALYSAKEFYREVLAQLNDNAVSLHGEDSADLVEGEHEELTISTSAINPEYGDVSNGKSNEANGAADEEEQRVAVTQARTKRSRAEVAGESEEFSSLNFLSFFKALDAFMTKQETLRLEQEPTRRVLYLALDHVDKLLDRGQGALLTCVCTINDQLSCLNSAGDRFRAWLVHLHGLLPESPDSDWLEFRAAVVHLLPSFQTELFPPSAASDASKTKKKLESATKVRVQHFLETRRKDLFGYHKLDRGDPSELISCTNLSRSCLLLVLAGYLASFNPQDADAHFLSSSGGVRHKKRSKKNNAGESATGSASSGSKKQQISQLLIGPRIFTLQRLLAIYLNLRAEAQAEVSHSVSDDRMNDETAVETREEIFIHLFQRTSPPNVLDDIKFRCLADARFVQETAHHLKFPLDAYLNKAP